ncbi:xylulokinase [Paenibacillus daejeonensis]|uniref:xylulokinase n=1 Tax=Paenibacillus daejeonensis TaxID=135193 RepID=UPI00035E84D4|nr:FGGY family carbohydrate kinase [Paenibacillus daejeonensis]
MLVLTADIGTQGTKVALVRADGTIAGSSFRPSKLLHGAGGTVEQDPADLVRSVTEGMREVLQRIGSRSVEVAAIALDGQMAGILGINEAWEPVTPYDSWLDTRCGAMLPELRAWGESEIMAITGAPVSIAHGAKKLWWRRERPETYSRIAKFVVPSAYVAGVLAGLRAEQAFIDETHLHFSGFADGQAGDWSETLLTAFGMERGKLPNIVRPWDIIGSLTAAWAQELGLRQGTPIVAGCGDTAASALGAGLVRSGQLLDIAGTASVLACAVDRYRPDVTGRTLIYARSAVPGLWAPLAYVGGGGQCLSWYREQWAGVGEGLTYSQLNELAAATAPGSDGLLFIPHLSGRVCPADEMLRGGWLGLHWGHGKGALYRAMMESIAYEYKHYAAAAAELAGPLNQSEILCTGGGSQAEVFNCIKADVLGIPLRTVGQQETALLGSALIAGYAVGLHTDLADAAESWTIREHSYEPNPANRATYDRAAARYRLAVDGLADLYRRMA